MSIYESELEKMEDTEIIKNIENIAYLGSISLNYALNIEVIIEKIENNYKISIIKYDTEHINSRYIKNNLTINKLKENLNINLENITDKLIIEYMKDHKLKEIKFYGLAVFDEYGNCLVED